MYYNTNNQRR